MSTIHRNDIDVIKGISIIAVVLYHIGILPYGYLGVDTFLVVNGFLIIPTIVKRIADDKFVYLTWLQKRIFRFMPLIIIASILCLLWGGCVMIPDDFENLSESIVASNIFCANILSAITTKDYWNTANEYKPLMHLWYLGIVTQFYVIFPLVLIIAKRCVKRSCEVYQIMMTSVLLITLASYILFILPNFNFSQKFYYLPFRVWEFGIGGLVGIISASKNIEISKTSYVSVMLILIGCLISSFKPLSQIDNATIVGAGTVVQTQISKELILITVVFVSAILLLKNVSYKWGGEFLAYIGRMSFSIFVWHQIFLAFLRYTFVDSITFPVLIIYFAATILVSYLSYKFIEPIKIESVYRKITLATVWALVIISSLFIYHKAGVVRDVPELDITVKNPYVSRNTEYIDRIYKFQSQFTTDKIKVLVVGNSFARDFACCLLEWDQSDKIELSYQYSYKEGIDSRYKDCDYLFCFGSKYDVPNEVWQTINPNCKVYGIGTKNYGKSFGRIYAKRNTKDYFDTAIINNALCESINNKWKDSWGDNYMDFVKISKNTKGLVQLFTPDKKIISFDCQHLTQNGCRFYAQKFEFEKIFTEISLE